jgi:hypothetical protein
MPYQMIDVREYETALRRQERRKRWALKRHSLEWADAGRWGRLPSFLVGRLNPSQAWRAANAGWLGPLWGGFDFADMRFFLTTPFPSALTAAAEAQMQSFCSEFDLVLLHRDEFQVAPAPPRLELSFVPRAWAEEIEQERMHYRAQKVLAKLAGHEGLSPHESIEDLGEEWAHLQQRLAAGGPKA